MTLKVDILLRGEEVAQTVSLQDIAHEPGDWTDEDVRAVLVGMLREMHRLKNPGQPVPRQIALRGLSWIVNPYDEGGVVIAIEITMGAAVAGPFDIDKASLEKMITRELARAGTPSSSAIH